MSTVRRHDIRLPGYDYSTPGTYFVTICVESRARIFGEILSGEMQLNDAGQLVESWWIETDRQFESMETDTFVIMPNHVHVLVRIGWTDGSTLAERFPHRDTTQHVSLTRDSSPMESRHGGLQLQVKDKVPLSRVVQWFKSATTAAYSRKVTESNWSRFPGRLWQLNYFEHIIRDEAELDRARAYVLGNPGKWSEDKEYRPVCRGF